MLVRGFANPVNPVHSRLAVAVSSGGRGVIVADLIITAETRGARVSYTRTGTGSPVMLIQGVSAIGNAWS